MCMCVTYMENTNTLIHTTFLINWTTLRPEWTLVFGERIVKHLNYMKMLVFSCQGTFFFSVVKYKPLKFNKTYTYPAWAYALGWFLGMFCVLLVPLWIIFKVTQLKGTVWQVCVLWYPNSDILRFYTTGYMKIPMGIPKTTCTNWITSQNWQT